MRILADENISLQLIEDLRKAGHDVRSIREDNQGETDVNIAVLCASEDRLLLTYDKDFGELVFAPPESAPSDWARAGVVLLRLKGMPYADRSKRVLDVLTSGEITFVGFFTVVEADRTRQRSVIPGLADES